MMVMMVVMLMTVAMKMTMTIAMAVTMTTRCFHQDRKQNHQRSSETSPETRKKVGGNFFLEDVVGTTGITIPQLDFVSVTE